MVVLRLFFVFLQVSVFAITADFDCVFVGSSPIPLIEALYQANMGKRVLIVEESNQCGGAWKSIDICGVAHADMGCHQIGSNPSVKNFLEEYIGCKMVPLNDPLGTLANQNTPIRGEYYPSQGCYELMSHILQLISKTNIVLLMNHKIESVYFDLDRQFVEVSVNGRKYTSSKLFIPPMCSLKVNNMPNVEASSKTGRASHLYVLIEDPTPFRFTYQNGFSGVSRIMNLTPFVGLQNTRYQLIIFQTHANEANAQKCIEHLINSKLVDPRAKILNSDTYTYAQAYFNSSMLNKLGPNIKTLFEVVNTSHIQNMGTYIPRWKTALKPYHEALRAA